MNKQLIIIFILGIFILLFLLKPTIVRIYCKNQSTSFTQKRLDWFNSLSDKEKEGQTWDWQSAQSGEDALFNLCLQNFGEPKQ